MAPSLRIRAPTKEQPALVEVTTATRSRRTPGASITPRSPSLPKSPVKLKRARNEKVIVIPSRRSSRGTAQAMITNNHLLARQREQDYQHGMELDDNDHSDEVDCSNRREIRAIVKGRLLIITGIPAVKRKFEATLDTKKEEEDSSAINDSNLSNGIGFSEPARKRRKVNWASRTAGQPRRSLRSDQNAEFPEMQDAESDDPKDQQGEDDEEISSPDGRYRKAGQHESLKHVLRQDDIQPTIEAPPGSSSQNLNTQPSTDITTQESQLSLQSTISKTSLDTNDTFNDAPIAANRLEPTLTSTSKTFCSKAQQSSPTSKPASSRRSTSPILTAFTLHQIPPSPPPSPNTIPPTYLPDPFLPFPDPLPSRANFPDEAAFLLASKFPPIAPPSTFIKAMTSHHPSTRSTETLFTLAANTQKALQAWQDEYIRLDKQTAPVAGPFPKKPATGGRVAVDPQRFEDEKERDLFGEGSLLAYLKVRRPNYASTSSNRGAGNGSTAKGAVKHMEGRELRKRRGDVSVVESLGVSDDDAGATEGKRTRKPVRRFEIGRNGEVTNGRGVGRRRRGGGLAAGRLSTSVGHGNNSIDQARQNRNADDYSGPNFSGGSLLKRSRLSVLQASNDFSAAGTDTDTGVGSPAPGDDEISDADYAGPHHEGEMQHSRRRFPAGIASSRRPAGTIMGVGSGGSAAGTAPGTAPAGNDPASNTSTLLPRKQRQKSEKRSESMLAWWAKRKRKSAEAKMLQQEAAARSSFGEAGGGIVSSGGHGTGAGNATNKATSS